VKQEENTFTVLFTKGVGTVHPQLSFTNNDDNAIQHQWTGNNQVKIIVPEARIARALFSLGEKEASVELNTQLAPITAQVQQQENQLRIMNIKGGKKPYLLEFLQNRTVKHTIPLQDKNAMVLNLKDLPLEKGSFIVRILDIREDETVAFKSDSLQMPTKQYNFNINFWKGKSNWAFLLVIPIIGGVLFLLYRRFVHY
jgi:hypothetical protein